jgi:hypothetical protein
MKKSYLFFLLFFVVSLTNIRAQSYDSLQVSLLTVKPRPNKVYTIYGHTALRLYDPSQNIDTVLNWGTFNFHTPYFIFRFIKGETDYFLSASPYSLFYYDYFMGNATVVEQILNIPNKNKRELVEKLTTELLPQNCKYRYNFLFDNCTTRPRDIIEKACGGKLVYPLQTESTTFRKLIHSCTESYPWMTFGIDLVIGSGADSILSFRQELFLPERLMKALEYSKIISINEEESPLVISSEIIIQSSGTGISKLKFWDSPLTIGIIILIIYTTLIFFGYRKRRKFRIPFALLFLTTGLAGCIVASLSFFSYHPCTQYNWNILWLHPIHFLGFIGFFFPAQRVISPDKKRKLFSKERIKSLMMGLICWFHRSNLVLLSFLLLAGLWIPQQLNPAIVPYILCLWIVSGYWLLLLKKKKHE